ncbi:hypothetical protein EDD85DRAFT_866635, partial [Armillaria nabsnona]
MISFNKCLMIPTSPVNVAMYTFIFIVALKFKQALSQPIHSLFICLSLFVVLFVMYTLAAVHLAFR